MNNSTSQTSHKKPRGFGWSFNAVVAAGSHKYKRQLHLEQLLPITTAKIDDYSKKNCKWILGRLATALRHERNRGKRAHWAYNLNQHSALLQAYRGEQKIFKNLRKTTLSKSTA